MKCVESLTCTFSCMSCAVAPFSVPTTGPVIVGADWKRIKQQ
jgi:hypothetical protein